MAACQSWSHWHDRLHRQLLRRPELLPDGASLLLAISGGQDSMALMGLLIGLQHLHHWQLHTWHGDHGWHDQSATVASELHAWCDEQALDLQISRSSKAHTRSEAKARLWRYQELAHVSERLHCQLVVTAHTASDRAETFLLQLARGTNLAGLGSLRPSRPLRSNDATSPRLVRPMLHFSRHQTALICQDLQLPIWLDPANSSVVFSRNRIRHEVLPVLEALHPGCSQRIAQLSERISHVDDNQRILASLALEPMKRSDRGLHRPSLTALTEPSRRLLLHHWLQQEGVRTLSANQLNILTAAIGPGRPPGRCSLPEKKTLQWSHDSVQLV